MQNKANNDRQGVITVSSYPPCCEQPPLWEKSTQRSSFRLNELLRFIKGNEVWHKIRWSKLHPLACKTNVTAQAACFPSWNMPDSHTKLTESRSNDSVLGLLVILCNVDLGIRESNKASKCVLAALWSVYLRDITAFLLNMMFWKWKSTKCTNIESELKHMRHLWEGVSFCKIVISPQFHFPPPVFWEHRTVMP